MLNNPLSGNTFPVATVLMYAGSSAPTGWLICNGGAINRTVYADLFAICGTVYGSGDSSTTFNIPDFRGVFPKGAGSTTRVAGVDANGTAYSATLGQYSQDKMQGHLHNRQFSGTAGSEPDIEAHTASIGAAPATITVTTNGPIADGTNGTPRTGASTEPQSLGINFIIKY